MIVLNWGGGTNSTALAIEATRRGLRFDLAVFADTGSERPETYDYLGVFRDWIGQETDADFVAVRWIRKRRSEVAEPGEFVSIHEWCERLETLPSRAFGLSGCTSKWKQQPVDNYLRSRGDIAEIHAQGGQVERWIGYDADEPARSERMLKKNPDSHLWRWRTPLVEWDMGREECVKAIKGAGLPLPGKSACWLCPSSTKRDIDRLKERHPGLLDRALSIERTAIQAGNVKSRGGLGGRLNWSDYIEGKASELALPLDLACGCFDG